ncbi:PfkB family carbohydrate kinase [Mucilaginibacter sp.]|uniref:PfkB family carbohydrate kinase n=1 Tax=Mucilaginibacter sp. TaxID=1882438 RepID=UPI0035BBE255
MNGPFDNIINKLQNAGGLLANKQVAAGFDGFIDSIVKVVNYKSDAEGTVFFNNIGEFGNYIAGKSGSGFSLESEELVQKLGGNMPIMANAMAQMGTMVNCVGAFGLPTVAPVFAGMHTNCKLHTYTNPGFTTAMEFADGKIMLAQMTDLNQSDWGTIKAAVGIEDLKKVFMNAGVVCLVNWSELDHSNNIWQGLLTDVFADSAAGDREFFFDLSDCSKRKPEAITGAIKMIEHFGNYGHVTLSLNRNEANILHEIFTGQPASADLKTTGSSLANTFNINTIIVHSAKISALWGSNEMVESEPVFIENPRFSTGAGDNFNAGYCIAKLLGLAPVDCLTMANSVSNRYITTGESPDLEALEKYFTGLAGN